MSYWFLSLELQEDIEIYFTDEESFGSFFSCSHALRTTIVLESTFVKKRAFCANLLGPESPCLEVLFEREKTGSLT